MVLGSMGVLSKAEQNKLQLQLHWNRETSRVRDAAGLQARRRRVQLLQQAAELKKTRMKARELGLPTDEVLRLRKVFQNVDDDNSGEIDLEELHQLCQTVQGGRLAHLTKWQLQQFMDENDDDLSGKLGFDEFLQLVSPRREQFRQLKANKEQTRLNKVEQNWNKVRDSRHRFAWNLYNNYQTQVARFGRKMGYTNEMLEQHVKQFESVDEDGSGEMELEELLMLFRSIGKNNITRDEAQKMMKPFDWRRVGRIDLMGFLEMMSPRRQRSQVRRTMQKQNMSASLQKQKELSKLVPQHRSQLEHKHADAALRRWSRKLGYKEKDVETIRRQFESIDVDSSGDIDLEELINMLKMSSSVPEHLKRANREEVKKLLDEYDHDKSATIDFREYLDLVSPRRQKHWEQQQLRNQTRKQQSQIKRMTFDNARYNAAVSRWNKHMNRIYKHGRNMGFSDDKITDLKNEFDKYDEDGSGDIDLNELTNIVCGPAMGKSHLTRDDLKIMMNEFDYNKSGTIKFAGFLEMMSPRKERARNKYLQDLEDLKKRAQVTSGLDSGNSITFRSSRQNSRRPRPPLTRRHNNSGGSGIRGRRSRNGGGGSGGGSGGGRITPRIGSSGTFGRSGASNGTEDIDNWIDESRGASPRGRPPSTMLPEVY